MPRAPSRVGRRTLCSSHARRPHHHDLGVETARPHQPRSVKHHTDPLLRHAVFVAAALHVHLITPRKRMPDVPRTPW
eukprot:2587708-Prymnesium_polylepis.1